MQRKRRVRAFKDRLTRWYVLVGGLAVLAAITLIFFYLAYVVLPLFQGAELTRKDALTPTWLQQDAGKPLMIALEEQNLVGMRVSDKGQVLFFDTKSGAELKRVELPIPAGVQVTSIGSDQPGSPLVVLGLSNGQALLFHHSYKITYPDGKKAIAPGVDFPYGEQPFVLDEQGRALEHVSVNLNGENLLLAGSVGASLQVVQITREENMMTGEVTSEQNRIALPQMSEPVKALYVDPRQQWLYVVNGRATADVFSLRDKSLNGRYKLLEDGQAEITASGQLVGGISLIFGDSKGGLSQWFMARDPDGEQRLKLIRSFQLGKAPVVQIDAEERRKGFVALDSEGQLGVFHSTAHRTLLVEPVAEGAGVLALSPRANRIVIEEGGKLLPLNLRNPHPEVSFSALWGKVWYENYDAPQYVWQSTASNTDFEPKLSLSPLTFGTLKAAFYAMILAAPLAIAAAIYTAYFMAPGMRRKVKPVIELMEAMPTVILGFFAGLFLAPYLEGHLPGVFSLFMILPLGILLTGFAWSRLPESIRLRVPDGWEAAILIPVIVAIGWFALGVSPFLENWLFGGDMRHWISNDLGITYDQRPGGGHRHGLRGDPEHLFHRRRRRVQCAAQPDPGFVGPGRHALADPDPRGHPDRQPRHLLGADDRHGPRGGRNHDRADGHRQHPGDGDEPVRRHAHPGRQRGGGDAGVRSRRQPLPCAVPRRLGAAALHLRHEHLGRADSPASAQEILVALIGR